VRDSTAVSQNIDLAAQRSARLGLKADARKRGPR